MEKVTSYDWHLLCDEGGYALAGFSDAEKKNFFKSKKLLFYDSKTAQDGEKTFVLMNPDPRWLDYLLEEKINIEGIKV